MASMLLDLPDSIWTQLDSLSVDITTECDDSSNTYRLATKYSALTKRLEIYLNEYDSCIADVVTMSVDRRPLIIPEMLTTIVNKLWTGTLKRYTVLVTYCISETLSEVITV